jgi:hypothetical protein
MAAASFAGCCRFRHSPRFPQGPAAAGMRTLPAGASFQRCSWLHQRADAKASLCPQYPKAPKISGNLTLPLRNVSLTNCFNSGKGNVDEERKTGPVHTGVQAGSGANGGVEREFGGSCALVGGGRANLIELGQGASLWEVERGKEVSGKAAVTAEQMEISRLRSELARVTMERDILGKATAYFAGTVSKLGAAPY